MSKKKYIDVIYRAHSFIDENMEVFNVEEEYTEDGTHYFILSIRKADGTYFMREDMRALKNWLSGMEYSEVEFLGVKGVSSHSANVREVRELDRAYVCGCIVMKTLEVVFQCEKCS